MLRGMGHDSEIFALTIDDDLRGDVRPFADAAARRGDVTIFHFALPVADDRGVRAAAGAKVLQYHNITPALVLRRPTMPGLFRLAALGRARARDAGGPRRPRARRFGLQPPGARGAGLRADRRHADRRQHRAASRSAPPRPALERILGDGLINILFVGRIVPNKQIEDHIRLAEMYKRYVDSYYRFIFVGRYDGVPRYYAQVRALIDEFKMLPDRFWFTGPVPDADLAAFYRWADAYVSLSEHEGFCVPLVEAMAADVPVVAYAAGAVPETLGGAGLLFSPKDLEFAAELLGTCRLRSGGPRQRPRRTAPAPRRISRRARLRNPAAATRRRARPLRNCFHRPTLRNGDPRRLRVPLPPDRRAARAEAPGRGPDDLRARLHHLEERLSTRAPTGSAA